jgi:hypothetical protein
MKNGIIGFLLCLSLVFVVYHCYTQTQIQSQEYKKLVELMKSDKNWKIGKNDYQDFVYNDNYNVLVEGGRCFSNVLKLRPSTTGSRYTVPYDEISWYERKKINELYFDLRKKIVNSNNRTFRVVVSPDGKVTSEEQ